MLNPSKIDIVCVGHACYDLIFQVPHHPSEDEKLSSSEHLACGGGPAANAAVAAARLGCSAEFIGYLGNDLYGDSHLAELQEAGVSTRQIQRGSNATPVATIIVKPNGSRSVINYTQTSTILDPNQATLDLSHPPSVLLVDGHQPNISAQLIKQAKQLDVVSILDAGSLHAGTQQLMSTVDYLATSEKFARQLTGQNDSQNALQQMRSLATNVIITLGEKGLIWSQDKLSGILPAFAVQSIDSTGAGDSFHAGLAVAITSQMAWEDALIYASAVGALCCTKIGARPGLPTETEVARFLSKTHQ